MLKRLSGCIPCARYSHKVVQNVLQKLLLATHLPLRFPVRCSSLPYAPPHISLSSLFPLCPCLPSSLLCFIPCVCCPAPVTPWRQLSEADLSKLHVDRLPRGISVFELREVLAFATGLMPQVQVRASLGTTTDLHMHTHPHTPRTHTLLMPCRHVSISGTNLAVLFYSARTSEVNTGAS